MTPKPMSADTMVERLQRLVRVERLVGVIPDNDLAVITEAADTITRLKEALASVSRRYAAAVAALEFAHSEGFEWPMDPFGPEAMAFADPTIVPEYEALSVGGE